MSLPDIQSVCFSHRYSFYFAGFISNLTQSTTCALDSRTSNTRPASQTLGKKFRIPFFDLLLCFVLWDISLFRATGMRGLCYRAFLFVMSSSKPHSIRLLNYLSNSTFVDRHDTLLLIFFCHCRARLLFFD